MRRASVPLHHGGGENGDLLLSDRLKLTKRNMGNGSAKDGLTGRKRWQNRRQKTVFAATAAIKRKTER